MKIFKNPNPGNWEQITKRPTQTVEDVEVTVNEIFSEVKKKGDQAVLKYTSFFDQIALKDMLVSDEEIATAKSRIDNELKQAILTAKNNITVFHKAQETNIIKVETTDGVFCWQEKRAIEKVGLYIPGGTAPLFSTVLMLAIPAKIAGCKEIILCSDFDLVLFVFWGA